MFDASTLPGYTGGTVMVNGVQLYYELAGAGAPLVFAHAKLTDRRLFDEPFARFASTHRVMRYDLRGFGLSESGTGSFSHYEDFYVLCRELNLTDLRIVGVSKGAELALSLAVEHPEMVSKLLLCSCRAGKPDVSSDLAARWAEFDRAIEAGDLERAIEVDLRDWVAGPDRDPASLPEDFLLWYRTTYREVLSRPRSTGEVKLEPPVATRLDEVSAPCTVVVGDSDNGDVRASSDILATRLGARKIVVENAGHLLPVERPDVFGEILRAFAFS